MRRSAEVLWGILVAVLVLSSLVLGRAGAASVPATSSVHLNLTSGGELNVQLNVTDPNGSALRLAMDGNFTAIIDALPVNNTTRQSLLEEIAFLEAESPGLFGDHSGVVSASEVAKFENLVEQGFARFPTGQRPSAVNVTLDGRAPVSSILEAVGFGNAEGPVTSTEPIYLLANLTQNFSVGGGGTHVLSIDVATIGSFDPLLPVSPGPTSVSFVGPAGTAISTVTGLSAVTTSNDVWGWGAPSSGGTYVPPSTTAVSFTYAPAFPWGYIVVAGVPIAAGVLVGLVWWSRRRRRRKPAATQPGVESSSSA